MFLYTGRDRKDIGIKDDVIGVEVELPGQQVVTPLADILAFLQVICLTVFIKGHDDNSSAITLAQPGLGEKFFLSRLEADGVHHCLALDTLQSGLDDIPL